MRVLGFSGWLRITMDHRGDSRCPVGGPAAERDTLWMPFERTGKQNGGGGKGLELFAALLEPAKTYCLIGSSGVGKSTLVNRLLHKEALAT
jgi:ABC-type transport system involved in cytochrome bd biosynthesis fused ATPase/permease subunit